MNADAHGIMPFDRFMKLALYDPAVGYYRQRRPRVGYGQGTDFFTATTSGAVFGEMVIAACRDLLSESDLQDYTFVEIGAEPNSSVLAGLAHPFAAARTISCTDSIELRGNAIVFSNELFDAQPFRRFVFKRGRWCEIAVSLRDGQLTEITQEANPPPELPAQASEGYTIDAPYESASLLRLVAGQPWQGLFIACDYGKTWLELIEATPAGTARAYHAHAQSNDLLARPGEQDLTCHICWDWLTEALEAAGFQNTCVDSQESFFIRHSAALISDIVEKEANRFSKRKLALMQLLHPDHLGTKFQVLHALRE